MPSITGVIAERVLAIEETAQTAQSSAESALTAQHFTVSSVFGAGDSWMAGLGALAPKYNYVQRLAAALGRAPVTNVGLSGGTVTGSGQQGAAPRIYQNAAAIPDLGNGPYFSFGGLKVDQCGFNDTPLFGLGADAAALIENCLMVRWAALKAARQVWQGNAAITKSAGVGVNTDNGTLLSMGTSYIYFSANGQYIDFALDSAYDGEPITFVIPMYSNYVTTGKLTFVRNPSSDNQTLGVFDGAPYDATLKLPETDRHGALGFRIPRGTLPSGAQTIRVTAGNLTGSNFATLAGIIIEGKAPLLLPLYRAKDPTVQTSCVWANQRIINVSEQFDNVSVVDPTVVLSNDFNLYLPDGAHPNNLGNARIAGKLLEAIPSLLTPENVSEMN